MELSESQISRQYPFAYIPSGIITTENPSKMAIALDGCCRSSTPENRLRERIAGGLMTLRSIFLVLILTLIGIPAHAQNTAKVIGSTSQRARQRPLRNSVWES
jgi:hypothetical protein